MASTDHLIQDEPTHDAVPPPARAKPSSGSASKKKPEKAELPPLPKREDEDEYQEFLAAKRAKESDSGPKAQVMTLEDETYHVATMDDNVMGHIQTIMLFGPSEEDTLGRFREILEAMLVPGEYERLSKHLMAYTKKLRKEHYEFGGEGEPPPTIPEITLSLIEQITGDLKELRKDPKA